MSPLSTFHELTAFLTLSLFIVLGPSWAVAGLPMPPDGACGVTIIKDASGGSGNIFEYEVAVDGDLPFLVELSGGESTGGSCNSTITVTEPPKVGWTLTDISCGNEGATGFEITENGFTAGCDGGGSVTCTFFNQGTVSSIPTLSEWGLIAMAGLMGIVGFMVMRRRKVTSEI